ncbi:COG4223 family protein [Jannaschia rubra]|uniref:COG4223 family protein n=1 Tax=Jannaschia rubra TaxID=282197 RepID=UPI00248FA2A4|nr:mitofilin family membrane protein [Jannaschia rubra]
MARKTRRSTSADETGTPETGNLTEDKAADRALPDDVPPPDPRKDEARPEDGDATVEGKPDLPDDVPPPDPRQDEARPEDGDATVEGKPDLPDDVPPPDPRQDEARPENGNATGGQDAKADRPAGTLPAPVPPTDDARRGPGFVPLVLGGLVAGAIGYAVSAFVVHQDEGLDPARIDALTAEVAALQAVEPPEPVDLSPLEQGQTDLSSRLDAVSDRVGALEDLPEPRTEAEATSTAEAVVDPLESTLDDLSSQVADLSDRLDERVSTLETDLGEATSGLDDVRARLSEVEAGLEEARTNAAAVRDQSQARAEETARNQIRLALQSGAPYVEPLTMLEGEAPAALAGPAETGVETQAALAQAFPPLARDALRVARRAQEATGVGSLFRNTFNPRSLEPREGDDPDAVLSRAEADVRAGDLDAALAEVETLPPDAQAVLEGWMERVRTRAAALSAADDYLQDG